MATVELKGVRKRYGQTWVVHGVDLQIPHGAFVVLVGPSGCGKSTLLRMIAGLEEVSEGQIAIDGRVVNDVRPADRDIAMVFQSYALYPHMTVRENVAFGLRLRKTPADEIARRVQEAAQILGITPYLDRYPKELSGGQRQRVAMGRAIVRQPKVFLFDEPLSNLDAALRGRMRVELRRLHQRLGATMIYVTHDQVEAMTLADRIVVLRDGRVQQVGPPQELYRRPANVFVGGFIGTPEMNVLPGTLVQGPDGAWAAVLGATEASEAPAPRVPLDAAALGARPQPGQRVLLGLRPSDLRPRPLEADAASDGALTARVEVLEPLGWESLVHLQIEGLASTAQAGARPAGDLTALGSSDELGTLQPGQRVLVEVAPTRVHVFDADTEERL